MMEEITLRWRTRPDNQEEANVYQSISDSLNLEGVTLVYEPGGSETASYQDVLKTELASGTAPDVFWIPGTDVADFATRGLLLDMRELADATAGYSDGDFYPGPMFHLTFNPETGNTGEVALGPAARCFHLCALSQPRPDRRSRRCGSARAGSQRRMDLGSLP